MKWVKAATGSLGQGLSVGVGMAAAMKLGKSPGRVFVMMGDGECAEGAVWEAANAGAYLKLRNICAVVDINRLGQSDPTMHSMTSRPMPENSGLSAGTFWAVNGHKSMRSWEPSKKLAIKARRP